MLQGRLHKSESRAVCSLVHPFTISCNRYRLCNLHNTSFMAMIEKDSHWISFDRQKVFLQICLVLQQIKQMRCTKWLWWRSRTLADEFQRKFWILQEKIQSQRNWTGIFQIYFPWWLTILCSCHQFRYGVHRWCTIASRCASSHSELIVSRWEQAGEVLWLFTCTCCGHRHPQAPMRNCQELPVTLFHLISSNDAIDKVSRNISPCQRNGWRVENGATYTCWSRFRCCKRRGMSTKSLVQINAILRQDPLDLGFWSFLTFLHRGIEKVERHLLWKCHKKIQRKSWSNMPPKLLACIRFLYKVVHKTAVSESSIALARLNLTFLPLGLSLWNLAHLFIMFMATNSCLRFFNFCLGT